MASAPADRYRPNYQADVGPPAAPSDVQNAMYEFQGHQRQGRRGPPRGGEFTFRHAARPRISDRPLFTEMRHSSPDPVFRGSNAAEKFRQLDDFTDSDEEEMDESRSGEDEVQRPNKRLRSGPAWSNPDPYTALPPVADTQRKKQDVVKLIRRSRVTPPAAGSTDAPLANGEDFISFDMEDDVAADIYTEDRMAPPANAPTGPKNKQADGTTQLGKRKRDPLDDGTKLPPKAKKGSRLHERGKILREWQASNLESSTPWYRPPSTPGVLPGVA
jgi:non-canonical poly(A) RNA polymerase PAPD5/7